MAEPVIQVKQASKHFGNLCAVNEIRFQVFQGSCFGFLGPNGAGKTTLMKMLYARIRRDHPGKSMINVFGFDPHRQELEIKYLAGVVPQEDNLDDELNVEKNLFLYARFYNIPLKVSRQRIQELLSFLELEEKRHSAIRDLSGGMKRRLVIARALLHRPKLLILDEPTTGLDPQVRHLIWDKLRQLQTEGTTLLLTTHYMEEAFQLCDQIMILYQGRKVMEGPPRTLLADHVEGYVLEVPAGSQTADRSDQTIPEHIRVDLTGQTKRFYSNQIDDLKALADQLKSGQYFLRQTNLEDVFLKATGRTLNEKQ